MCQVCILATADLCAQVACYKICNVRVNAMRQNSEPMAPKPASLCSSSDTSKQGLLMPQVEEVTKSTDLEPTSHEKVLLHAMSPIALSLSLRVTTLHLQCMSFARYMLPSDL